jgi:hypothetical protein
MQDVNKFTDFNTLVWRKRERGGVTNEEFLTSALGTCFCKVKMEELKLNIYTSYYTEVRLPLQALPREN